MIAPLLGMCVVYLFVLAVNNGWSSARWQAIERPPAKSVSLPALSQDSLWVRSADGTIYYNPSSASCPANCWQAVPEVPVLPVIGPQEKP